MVKEKQKKNPSHSKERRMFNQIEEGTAWAVSSGCSDQRAEGYDKAFSQEPWGSERGSKEKSEMAQM